MNDLFYEQTQFWDDVGEVFDDDDDEELEKAFIPRPGSKPRNDWANSPWRRC